MTDKLFVSVVLIALMLAVSACSRETSGPAPATELATPSTQKITSTSVVRVMPEPVELTAGGAADTTVRLSIQDGYHVNANPPTYSYLKATELDIPASEGVSVKTIVYPDPLTRKFSFADEPLAVYEGDITIKLSLTADSTAQKGARQLSGKIRIQACDDEVCYPPGAMELSIPLHVK